MSEFGLFLNDLRKRNNEKFNVMAQKLNLQQRNLIELENGEQPYHPHINNLIEQYDLIKVGKRIYFNCTIHNCNTPVPVGELFCTEHDEIHIPLKKTNKPMVSFDERYSRLVNRERKH